MYLITSYNNKGVFVASPTFSLSVGISSAKNMDTNYTYASDIKANFAGINNCNRISQWTIYAYNLGYIFYIYTTQTTK